MKGEYKRMDQAIDEMIQNAPIEKVQDFFYNKTYESKKALWLDNNLEGYKRKEKELDKLIKRMTYQQRRACLDKESEAFNDTLYDLRIMLRSEALEYLGVVIAIYWLIGSVREHLEAYKEAGMAYDLEYAMSICQDLNDTFKGKFWNDETMEDMESFLESLKDAPELTDQDKEFIDSLSEYPKRYKAMKEAGMD